MHSTPPNTPIIKKQIIILLLLSAPVCSQAQVKGIPFDHAVPADGLEYYSDDELYGVLIKAEKDSIEMYIYAYELIGKGYYDALKQLSWLLVANNIDRPADIEDSFFELGVDDSNYNKVVTELKLRTGWIERSWIIDDYWEIGMKGDDEIMAVYTNHYHNALLNLEEQQTEQQSRLNLNAIDNQCDLDSYGTGNDFGNSGIGFGLEGRGQLSLPLPNI